MRLVFWHVAVVALTASLFFVLCAGGAFYTDEQVLQVSSAAWLKHKQTVRVLAYVVMAWSVLSAAFSAYMLWRNRLVTRRQVVKRVARDVEDIDPHFLDKANAHLTAQFERDKLAWRSELSKAEHELLYGEDALTT